MGKGRAKYIWMNTKEVRELLEWHIEREFNVKASNRVALYINSVEMEEFYTSYHVRPLLKDEFPLVWEATKDYCDRTFLYWITLLRDSVECKNETFRKDAIDTMIKEFSWIEDPKYKLTTDEEKAYLSKCIDNHLWVADFEDKNFVPYYYYYVAGFLDKIGVENNISDYAEALATRAYDSVIPLLKIEKKSLGTNLLTKEKSLKLLEKFGYRIISKFGLCYGFTPLLEVKQITKFAYLMSELENKGYIYSKWQSIISSQKIAINSNGKYLTNKDLSEALRAARTTAESVKKGEVQKEYEEIKRFVESL